MAFPTKLAQQWIIAFLRNDCALDSGELLWEAHVLSKGQGSPAQHQQLADLYCFNGFRIYVGLLTRLTDRRWTNRLDAALARLWPRRTPYRIHWLVHRRAPMRLEEPPVLCGPVGDVCHTRRVCTLSLALLTRHPDYGRYWSHAHDVKRGALGA